MRPPCRQGCPQKSPCSAVMSVGSFNLQGVVLLSLSRAVFASAFLLPGRSDEEHVTQYFSKKLWLWKTHCSPSDSSIREPSACPRVQPRRWAAAVGRILTQERGSTKRFGAPPYSASRHPTIEYDGVSPRITITNPPCSAELAEALRTVLTPDASRNVY